MSVPVPHYLYRCYDADGRLLYIGCTSSVVNRMAGHRTNPYAKASRWLRACMDRYEVDADRYPNKQAGHEAESAAILDEQPLFNLQGRRISRPDVFHPIAHYLIEHGHFALALETTCTCWEEDRVAGLRSSWCVPHAHLADLAVAA